MRGFALAGFLVLAAGFAAARAEASPVVVELFTSQGCSSCPPADAFLTDLTHERTDILALAFHVTYWDRLGWHDPYSFDGATARQQEYARSLGDGEVYTPEMVVNGVHGFVGSDRAQGLAAIAEAAATAHTPVPVSVTRDGDGLAITVGAGAGSGAVLLVGFDPEHQTPIGHGENGGRTLLESNIVRSLTRAAGWTGAAATYRQPVPVGERVAVLLQADNGSIIAAAVLAAPPV